MDIVLASRNKKKKAEMQTLLSELGGKEINVLSLDDIGYTEEIVEDGETFFHNALIKAGVPASLGYIGIADDSGLMVDALDGAPGVYSARYSGETATDRENNEKLLSEMKDIKNRAASYISVIAFAAPDNMLSGAFDTESSDYISRKTGKNIKAVTFEGSCSGTLLQDYAGDGGFGYDPLFYVEEYHRTFAQITAAEKNKISHRARAMCAFAEWIAKIK